MRRTKQCAEDSARYSTQLRQPVDPGITAARAAAILSLLFSFRALAARCARL